MKIRKIAIVGGGTAGWIAANHLGVELSRDPDIQITLIESKDVPVIGVGEGTVPRIKETLHKFGISEIDLLATCDATLKTGIKFSNWMAPEKGEAEHFYYHPFSSPYPKGYDVTDYWLTIKRDVPFSHLSDVFLVAEGDKCPKRKSSPPYLGAVDYAYHFNAAKFSELLASNAKRRFDVQHKFETVCDVRLDDRGSIEKLVYASGSEEAFDFYIDCSGFNAALLGKALDTPFEDKSSQILTDTALVLQEETAPDSPIQPYTTARAHKAGWIWDIPLTTRRGLGCVYSSAHMSDSEAAEEFSSYLGRSVDSESVRKIPMKIGYRQQFWKKNCVALGLAQGFVEPLEATSILVTDFSASLLAKSFPKTVEDIPLLTGYYNKAVRYTWERVIDFVQLHYCISDRQDSDFWLDCTRGAQKSDVLEERLQRWKVVTPKSSDFFSTFDIFGVENHLYVLYGMDFDTRPTPIAEKEGERAHDIIRELREHSAKVAGELMPHRTWLSELQRHLAQMAAR
ncbi:tryptophan halogenase family protein [Microbulbifer hydrolyticus]|uniref:Tryptophan 7-halogenase n=1 Tax=Microbulbifer hydrolyticus TaxID=48074 RepID=A0A6P1TCI4_9GAMM|nr:tryptophan halogenase family protein [Microbulbifer hydrolyticus]MBB5212801.1 tryptophan halogenase [Microbulbifer hydrolyticus]QHQ38402.1 tryptophan 7-halogenase [Microbulbifer hydrolyticus]